MHPANDPKLLSVLVVEDSADTRDELCAAIAREPGMQLAASFEAVLPAIAWLTAGHVVDVLLIDLGLPDGSGIDVIRACVLHQPQCSIMVISMFGDENNVLAAIDAGAVGYVLKSAGPLDVGRFIAELRQGGSPMSSLIARKLLQFARLPTPSPQKISLEMLPLPGLSVRELDVLDRIARGYTYQEVANLLMLSVGTVQTHIKSIYTKLAVHNRSEAVFEAHKLGLLVAASPQSKP